MIDWWRLQKLSVQRMPVQPNILTSPTTSVKTFSCHKCWPKVAGMRFLPIPEPTGSTRHYFVQYALPWHAPHRFPVVLSPSKHSESRIQTTVRRNRWSFCENLQQLSAPCTFYECTSRSRCYKPSQALSRSPNFVSFSHCGPIKSRHLVRSISQQLRKIWFHLSLPAANKPFIFCSTKHTWSE